MLTGRQTFSSLEHALSDLRREEAELGGRIERITRSLTDLKTRQADAYKELARFRLDNLQADALDGRLDQNARTAGRLMEKRTRDYAVLSDQLRQKEAEHLDLQTVRDNRVEEAEALAERMDGLMEEVDANLEQDEAFQKQKARASEAVKTADAAALKAKTALEDRQEKGKAYEADALFVYLWDRGYGTPDYTGRGLVRSLDGWVAGLIRYHDARSNYAMLTGIPERMARHAERCGETVEQENHLLAELSREALSRMAGEDLAGRIDGLSTGIAGMDDELEALERSVETLQEALQTFSRGEDDDFLKAEDHLSHSLSGDDLRDLWREAIETPSPEDERIVRRIEDHLDRIEELQREIRQDRQLLRDISRRRSELTKVTQKFRRNGYDSWESTFSDNALTTVLLGELVKGAISGADYWARAQGSHRRRKPRGGKVGFPGGSGLPHSMGGFGGGFGGGSGDGGGFSSGGSFGGDGFSTGDTF